MKRTLLLLLFTMIAWGANPQIAAHSKNNQEEAVVKAVFFYSPSCPHCHFVLNEVIPPLQDEFEGQLQILYIDVQTSQGENLFWATVEHFNVSKQKQGVPMLVVGEQVLVGSAEIPERFPGLIQEGLAQGGISWPGIPGLSEEIQRFTPRPTSTELPATPTSTSPPTASLQEGDQEFDRTPTASPSSGVGSATESPPGTPQDEIPAERSDPGSVSDDRGMAERIFARIWHDLPANGIAIGVLVSMIASLFSVVAGIFSSQTVEKSWPGWVIPALTLIGLGAAGYLSTMEITDSRAICGPVGDCHAVQQSPYARIGGVIPVAHLGLLGYLAIGGCWIVYHRGGKFLRRWSGIAMWGMTVVGTIFSIYLTFLEPFVIGATCAWCLTSSVVMTLLLWAATAEIEPQLHVP